MEAIQKLERGGGNVFMNIGNGDISDAVDDQMIDAYQRSQELLDKLEMEAERKRARGEVPTKEEQAALERARNELDDAVGYHDLAIDN